MNNPAKHTFYFLIGIGTCLIIWLFNLGTGSVIIPVSDLVKRPFEGPFPREAWEIILMEYRLPKSITAMLAGIGLSISGLQMQTFFRNPLAGPYVLGISSGAGLGVGILSMAGTALGWQTMVGYGAGWPIILAASIGSILVLLLIGLTAWRVRDSMTLLILGLMFGSIASAGLHILAYFSEAEQLKMFMIWSMGSLGDTGWDQVKVLAVAILVGLIPVILWIKPFNAMLLGENYAQSLGVNTTHLKWVMIISTGILTGSITAFCGPIAFIGIAIPHIARMAFKTSDHKILFPAVALIGTIGVLFCDSLSQLPGSYQTLPINAVTTLIGAPVVIWLIIKRDFSKEF
ncbi:MAG: iron ABC transporter permease [Cyclobacteriaceae bacterium]